MITSLRIPALILALAFVIAACQSGGATVPTETPAPTPTPVSAGTFSPTGSMSSLRQGHTATLLPNGKVLMTGGGAQATAELYDPTTGTFSPTESMSTAREEHTATLLPNGRVLIAGGDSGMAPWTFWASAELYDPATGRFSPTGSMATARTAPTATLLKDGRVLITGGGGGGGGGDKGNWPVASAELYDPGTGSFSPTGSMVHARTKHTATLLPSGKVLIVGGWGDSNDAQTATQGELYDPDTGTFSATGSMAFPRSGHTATLLPTGKVLICGGNGGMNDATEIYDPSTGKFSLGPFIPDERLGASATLLAGGKVLIAGGAADSGKGNVVTAAIYDPATNSFSRTGSMSTARFLHTATLLADGRILVAGGAEGYGGSMTLDSAEVYSGL